MIRRSFTKILLSLCRRQNITEQECIFRTAQIHITEINQPWFSRVRRDNCVAGHGVSHLSGNPKFGLCSQEPTTGPYSDPHESRTHNHKPRVLCYMYPVHTLTRHCPCATCTQYTPSHTTVPVPHLPSTHPHTPLSLCHMYPVHTLTRHVSLCHIYPVHTLTRHCPCATCTQYTPLHATCPCAIYTQYTHSHATVPVPHVPITHPHATCPCATRIQYTPSHATCPCATRTQYTPSHSTCP